MTLRVLDCFAGIGGFSLGFDRAGFESVAFCEIEPFPQSVLRKHWPGAWIHDDIRTLTAELVRKRLGYLPEVIIGGPPCQPVSSAGPRKGEDDERWLWPEFIRVVSAVMPRWVVAENPIGLLSHPSGAGIIPSLEAAGYEVYDPLVLGSSSVGGSDRRLRVWLVANATSGRGEARLNLNAEARGSGSAGGTEAGLDAVGRREVRWPARPGHTQREWEDARSVEPEMVPPVDGFPARLARRWRRAAHLAVGNAVNPACAEVIGRAIMEAEGA